MNAIDRLAMSTEARASLTADAADLLRLALAAQGPAALVCSREHAARHEAGHAIGHTVSGRRVLSVRVFERSGLWLGWCAVAGPGWRVDQSSDPAADLDQVRTLLAGPLAELLTSSRPALAGGLDEIALARGIAAQAAAKLGEAPESVMLGQVADVVAFLGKHRSTLEALAAALTRERVLKGHQLKRLLCPAVPDRREY